MSLFPLRALEEIRGRSVYPRRQCTVCVPTNTEDRHHFCLAGEEAEMRNAEGERGRE